MISRAAMAAPSRLWSTPSGLAPRAAGVPGARLEGVEATVERLVDRVGQAAAAAVLLEAERLVEGARAEWPVRTGASRDAFELGVEQEGLTVAATVANAAPYAADIRGGEVVAELLERPAREAGPRIAAGVIDGVRAGR